MTFLILDSEVAEADWGCVKSIGLRYLLSICSRELAGTLGLCAAEAVDRNRFVSLSLLSQAKAQRMVCGMQ
jgi:hypothetical protein